MKSVKNFTCTLNRTNKNKVLVNTWVNVTETLEDITVMTEAFYKYSFTFKPFMINQTEDFCAYMKGDIRNAIVMHIVLKSAMNHMKNYKCPVQVNHIMTFLGDLELLIKYILQGVLTLTDYELQFESYLGVIPHGEYRIDVTMMSRRRPVAFLRGFFNYMQN